MDRRDGSRKPQPSPANRVRAHTIGSSWWIKAGTSGAPIQPACPIPRRASYLSSLSAFCVGSLCEAGSHCFTGRQPCQFERSPCRRRHGCLDDPLHFLSDVCAQPGFHTNCNEARGGPGQEIPQPVQTIMETVFGEPSTLSDPAEPADRSSSRPTVRVCEEISLVGWVRQ